MYVQGHHPQGDPGRYPPRRRDPGRSQAPDRCLHGSLPGCPLHEGSYGNAFCFRRHSAGKSDKERHRIRDSFNSYPVDAIAQKVAAVAISENDWVMENVRKICSTRDRIAEELRARGWVVPESKTNFLFAKPSGLTAEAIYTNLRGKGILVRYFNKPRISEYLRITIGTDEEMDALLKAVDEIAGGN